MTAGFVFSSIVCVCLCVCVNVVMFVIIVEGGLLTIVKISVLNLKIL